MFRFLLPTILVGTAVAGFFVFTDPLYQGINIKKIQMASYDEALNNSKTLEAERDKLTQKYNSFDPNNLAKLQKLLPDNVDNIRLILEIENIAKPYGMVLKDVKYNVTDNGDTTPQNINAIQNGGGILNNNYGVWNLEFSTQGTYNNFVSLVKDLENNLRIVDVSSIEFSASGNVGLNPSLPEAYTYDFKIKTYWLKN